MLASGLACGTVSSFLAQDTPNSRLVLHHTVDPLKYGLEMSGQGPGDLWAPFVSTAYAVRCPVHTPYHSNDLTAFNLSSLWSAGHLSCLSRFTISTKLRK